MKFNFVSNIQLHTYRQAAYSPVVEFVCDCFIFFELSNLFSPSLAFLLIYSLELPPSCNNRCPGCSNVFVRTGEKQVRLPLSRPMSLKQWVAILDKIAPYAHSLKLTGGESLLHPQFYAIMRTIQQRGLSFSLFTNGRWQYPVHVIDLLQDMPQCRGLLISLHGADAVAHEAFNGVKGSFEETIANIRRSTQAGLVVHTYTVVTPYNYTQVESLVNLSQSLGSTQAVFNRYIGQAMSPLNLPPSVLKEILSEVDELGRVDRPVKFDTCIPLCFVEASATGCLAGTAYCAIDSWGNVRPCNHAPQVAGNLFTEPLGTIWWSEIMEAWRNLLPTKCETCAAFSRCHGGYRADAVLKELGHDSLMTVPLEAPLPLLPEADANICLYEMVVPHLEYTLQEESFGPILNW